MTDIPNIRPLNDVMLVRAEEPEKVSDLIIAPDSYAAPLAKGTVVRVGPGRDKLISAQGSKKRYVPTQIKPGERIVFFAAAAGTKQGRQLAYSLPDGYLLLREEDVLFVTDADVKVDV